MLAIGECALWDNKIYGLVAPGYQMARIAAATLAGEDACFSGADMSTKLKLLGSTWPRLAMRRAHAGLSELSMDRRSAADYKNRRQSGRQSPAWRRAGGDASDYATLLQMMLNGMALPPRPESLILPALEEPRRRRSASRRCRTTRRSAPAITSAKAISAGGEQWGGDMSAIKLHQSGYRLRRLQRAGETGDGVSAGGAGRRSEKDVCEHFPWSRQRSTTGAG